MTAYFILSVITFIALRLTSSIVLESRQRLSQGWDARTANPVMTSTPGHESQFGGGIRSIDDVHPVVEFTLHESVDQTGHGQVQEHDRDADQRQPKVPTAQGIGIPLTTRDPWPKPVDGSIHPKGDGAKHDQVCVPHHP